MKQIPYDLGADNIDYLYCLIALVSLLQPSHEKFRQFGLGNRHPESFTDSYQRFVQTTSQLISFFVSSVADEPYSKGVA